MTEQIHNDYEVSSEGAVRHQEVSYAVLDDATPTPSNPAMVNPTATNYGNELTGTILTIHAGDSIAIIDFTSSMVYQHDVRNVLTYAVAVEATWAVINEGDVIYYDRSATMPAGVYLSTSPLDNNGNANPVFGWAVLRDSTDTYPKGAATATSVADVRVMQRGAGSA